LYAAYLIFLPSAIKALNLISPDDSPGLIRFKALIAEGKKIKKAAYKKQESKMQRQLTISESDKK
jgi:hypothetical protein